MIALAAWARDRIVVVGGETWVRVAGPAWDETWSCARLQTAVGRVFGEWYAGGPYRFDRTSRDSAMRAAIRHRGSR